MGSRAETTTPSGLRGALLACAAFAALALSAPRPCEARPPTGARARLVPLPLEGRHHYVLFAPYCYEREDLAPHYPDSSRTRNYYGTPRVVRAIQVVAAEVRRRHPDAARLGVGELSNRAGGKIPFHHSHRRGVDVDIAYLVRAGTGRTRHPVPMCSLGQSYERELNGVWQVTSAFDPELNWTLAATLARRRDVKVIFVGGLVLPALLDWADRHRIPRREQRLVRSKLRDVRCRGSLAWAYRRNPCPHDDHFHVRFFGP